MMEAIILAGGLGTRLRRVVPDRPKPMAPVAGKPFLEWLLQALAVGGLEKIVLSVGYLAEHIFHYFGHTFAGLTLEYCTEEEPLGTGGAIVKALRQVGSTACFVLNGDTFFGVDYRVMEQRFKGANSKLMMALKNVPDAARYGRVITWKDTVIRFDEKGHKGPGLINGGVYLIDHNLFSTPPPARRFSFETDFLQPRVAQLRPTAFISTGYFIDIGVPNDYAIAQSTLINEGGFNMD